jgi:hypothetical protein
VLHNIWKRLLILFIVVNGLGFGKEIRVDLDQE